MFSRSPLALILCAAAHAAAGAHADQQRLHVTRYNWEVVRAMAAAK